MRLRFLLGGSCGFCSGCLQILEQSFHRNKGLRKRSGRKQKRTDFLFAYDDALGPLWMRIFVHADLQAAEALMDFILEQREIRLRFRKKTVYLADERFCPYANLWQKFLEKRHFDVCLAKPEKKAYTAVLLFENPAASFVLEQDPLCQKIFILQQEEDQQALSKENSLSKNEKNLIFRYFFRR